MTFLPEYWNAKTEKDVEEIQKELRWVDYWHDETYNKSTSFGIDNPWMPNTQMNFGSRTFGIKNSLFQRTPEEIYYVVSYKFMSVDGEISNSIRYNILEQWKQYQTKIGLR